MLFQKRQLIAVHDGKFHADDIFAAATLRLVTKGKARIVRTRDQKIIDAADYVADVGGVHDPEKNRFDHHQIGGAGTHENGIPYAAFGLVWKKYGGEIAGNTDIAVLIEKKLVTPIDADDNGVALTESRSETIPYGFHSFLYSYRPTWKEDAAGFDIAFIELVAMAEKLILREVKIASDTLEAEKKVEDAYRAAADKRIIELGGSYPYQEVLTKYPEPLYVVSPRSADKNWKVETVRKAAFGFESRKPLPASWAGARDEALAELTGVLDAIFCHNGRFLAVAKSRDGALALAKLAAGN